MVMGLKIKYYPSLEVTGPFSLPFQVTGNAIPKLIQTCHKTCLLAPPLGLFIVYRVLSDSKYGYYSYEIMSYKHYTLFLNV